MGGDRVEDIVKGREDFSGARIETVFYKVSGVYAIYATDERVLIQYADETALGTEQRKALVPLNPVRGEINGLIDGWRSTNRFNATKRNSLLRRFDRRTADALTVALQGDQEHAAELLQAVKNDILEERTSLGRTEYLITAIVTALAIFILFDWLAKPASLPFTDQRFGVFTVQHQLWLASGVGALGALFSIALNISSRNVKTDLQRRDNIVDAILRIIIGAVSAIILFSLLRSGLVTFMINGNPIALQDPAAGGKATHFAIVVAFLAGFSERLVGDFLSNAVLGIKTATPATAKEQTSAEKAAANENNPRGKAGAPEDGKSDQHEGEPVVHDHDGDACPSNVQLTPEEITDDKQLPEATGGVAKAP